MGTRKSVSTVHAKGSVAGAVKGKPAAIAPKSAAPATREVRVPVNAMARSVPPPDLPVVEREVMVAEAAYYLAERRGFAPGGELLDWLAAEAEIERLLGR